MFCDKCGTENRDEAEFCISCGSKLHKIISPARPPGGLDTPSDNGSGKDDYIERFKAAVSHRYKIIRELGRGGMAIVFLAEDNRLERKVALKLLPRELSYDENLATRFLMEAKMAAQLLHPNIIQIHDVDTSGEFYYFSMAYIEGVPLDQILKKSGSLKPRVVAQLAVLVSFALQHAHEKGVIHRDIKPENIIINKKRQPIVVDFGIAKAQRSSKQSQTKTGMMIGTPMYMSPEQIKEGKEVDGRSDIYSLGSVLYQMAVGKPPFHGLTQAALLYNQVNELPPPPHIVNSNVPEELSAIIMKAIAKNPGDRFQSAAELGKVIHETFLAAPSEKSKATKDKLPDIKAVSGEEKEGEKEKIAETVVIPAASAMSGQPAEASDESAGSSLQLGDTLVAPVQPKKKDVEGAGSKAPTKKKSRAPLVLAVLTVVMIGILLYSLYTVLHEKRKPSKTVSLPFGVADKTEEKTLQPEDTVKDEAQKPAPVTPAVKKPVTKETKPVESDAAGQSRDTIRQKPPQIVKDTSDKKIQPVKKPEQVPDTEDRQQKPDQPKRESAEIQPQERKPTEKTVEKPPEDRPAKETEERSTPVASLVKPEIEPEKSVEKPEVKPEESVQIVWITIPGGTFQMGDSRGDMDERMLCRPVHRVTVSSFQMSRDEITVGQYAVFLRDTGRPEPLLWKLQMTKPERPVINVSWNDAYAFAQWAGARLPTEAEWEYAARGGMDGKLYPWGDESPQNHANYGNNWNDGNGWLTSIKKPGTFGPNRFGLNDMAGNVWEWCSDLWGPYQAGLVVNPTGVSQGEGRVVRGGAWNSSAKHIRNSVRGPRTPDDRVTHTGFRLARGVKQ